MENQHADNRILVSPAGKKIKYNTWKFKKDTDCLGRQGSLFTEKKLMVTG